MSINEVEEAFSGAERVHHEDSRRTVGGRYGTTWAAMLPSAFLRRQAFASSFTSRRTSSREQLDPVSNSRWRARPCVLFMLILRPNNFHKLWLEHSKAMVTICMRDSHARRRVHGNAVAGKKVVCDQRVVHFGHDCLHLWA